jgi:hypothetical protein
MSTTPSTTIVTNLKTTTPPTTNTLAAAAADGIDMPGMLSLALSKANELKVCLTLIVKSTDGADPKLATLNDILASLT